MTRRLPSLTLMLSGAMRLALGCAWRWQDGDPSGRVSPAATSRRLPGSVGSVLREKEILEEMLSCILEKNPSVHRVENELEEVQLKVRRPLGLVLKTRTPVTTLIPAVFVCVSGPGVLT